MSFYTICSLVFEKRIPLKPLMHLIDQLLSDMDKDYVSGLVFLSYKKAFDLMDHGILLSKPEVYGLASN